MKTIDHGFLVTAEIPAETEMHRRKYTVKRIGLQISAPRCQHGVIPRKSQNRSTQEEYIMKTIKGRLLITVWNTYQHNGRNIVNKRNHGLLIAAEIAAETKMYRCKHTIKGIRIFRDPGWPAGCFQSPFIRWAGLRRWVRCCRP